MGITVESQLLRDIEDALAANQPLNATQKLAYDAAKGLVVSGERAWEDRIVLMNVGIVVSSICRHKRTPQAMSSPYESVAITRRSCCEARTDLLRYPSIWR